MTSTLTPLELPDFAGTQQSLSPPIFDALRELDEERERSDARAERRFDDPALDVGDGWTTIYNVSPGGMCVVTLRRLQAGQVAVFDLRERHTQKAMNLKGEVVWAVPVTGDLCKAGIRWLDQDHEIREWLSQYIR